MKSLKKMSEAKKSKEVHSAGMKYGMGDYYGTGFKAPLGKMRGSTVEARPVSPGKLGKPPKSLG